jgi:hypothetical protein
VLRAKERAQTPSPFVVFTFGLIVESIKELGGALDIMEIPIIHVHIMFMHCDSIKKFVTCKVHHVVACIVIVVV